ncbi:MAG: biotin--[acetyl-CoA-carboxylase] ligase [Prevotellaceae bacterium]|nr:biotin--[acetyl-CoA-carboxylase] ligase [Candidatus Colivivens caballi]
MGQTLTAKHIHLNETESTNTYLKELIQAGVVLPELTLVDAEYQTGGRGQTGNHWESRKGENLTFSLLCHPECVRADHQFVLSQAVALAVQQTLLGFVDDVTVKWPNDIYWRDKKICGILIECTLCGASVRDCIIGVGLNVNQMQFESDAPNPVSLAQIVGLTFNRKAVLDGVVQKFAEYYDKVLCGEDISPEYKRNLYRREGMHCYAEPEGEPFMAQMCDVLPSGHLVLQDDKGQRREYEFKEVKFVLPQS